MLPMSKVPQARFVALLVLSAALPACRISPSGSLIGPSLGAEKWSVAESKHFTVHADLSEKETIEVAKDLERTYRILFEIGFPMDKDPNLTTDAVVFRTREEYLLVGPPASGGAFRPGGFGREEGATFMTFGGIGVSARHTFVHEMTHRFVYHACPQAPTWLNEGLADYYETITYGDGKAVIGRSPFVFKKGESWTYGNGGVPTAALPKWDELISLDPKHFYAGRTSVEGDGGKEERQRQTANYASAWATVYVLQNKTEHYGDRLYQYMSKMASGTPSAEAFRQTLGDLDPAMIDGDRADLVEHLALGDATIFKIDHDERREIPVESRELNKAEELLVLAELDLRMKGDQRAAARAHVDQALARQPGLTSALLLSAALYRSTGAFAEAEADLDHALRTAPDDESVAEARFAFYWRPLKGHKQEAAHVAKAEEILKEWLPKAKSPETLNSFAWYMTLHGRAAEAIPIVKRAIAVDPSSWAFYDTLALALFRTGAYKEAVTVQEMAIAVEGERRGESRAAVRLAGYQDVWSQMVLWKKRPPAGRDPAALPPDVAAAILRAQGQEILDCYHQTLTRAPELAGSIVIRGEIGTDGKLTGISLVPRSEWESLPNKPPPPAITEEDLTRCVLEQAGATVFPASSEPMKIMVPFRFAPEKASSD